MRVRHRRQLQRQNVWKIKELGTETTHSNETQGVTCCRIECPSQLPTEFLLDSRLQIVSLSFRDTKCNF